MKTVCLRLILLLVLGSIATAQESGDAVVRVNCGGPALASGWSRDTLTNGTVLKSVARVGNVQFAPQAVYQSCRTARRLTYSFPDVPQGQYLVHLHFAELLTNAPGQRRFNIRIQGFLAVTNLDVAALAGTNQALRLSFLVSVTNNNGLTIKGKGKRKANAFFSGIEVETIPPPAAMIKIPGGSFDMGDPFAEASLDQRPVHRVTVTPFYIDETEVTRELWDEVFDWAVTNGYAFDNPGSGKDASHPVHSVSWQDSVKWCNARSEREGRVPAYYTSTAFTNVYRTGSLAVSNEWVLWDAGYRLPTEAEWERAARGGADGRRFPWSDSDTIQHERANYFSSSAYSYDTSPTRGYHPDFTGTPPYTSPAGSFPANDYGLFDMTGNVGEWCWDWYGPDFYETSPENDPRGPPTGRTRIYRGGSWSESSFYNRLAQRNSAKLPSTSATRGFRTVLSPVSP